jgi:hypothetical protein
VIDPDPRTRDLRKLPAIFFHLHLSHPIPDLISLPSALRHHAERELFQSPYPRLSSCWSICVHLALCAIMQPTRLCRFLTNESLPRFSHEHRMCFSVAPISPQNGHLDCALPPLQNSICCGEGSASSLAFNVNLIRRSSYLDVAQANMWFEKEPSSNAQRGLKFSR